MRGLGSSDKHFLFFFSQKKKLKDPSLQVAFVLSVQKKKRFCVERLCVQNPSSDR